jgi:DNA-binding transcriptional LysR family regulator
MTALRELEIRHLLALDAVAGEGTFGRAADRLGYTQSAVSQQIAALERIVGGSLFDRPGGPRPVELTPLGELVLLHARQVLQRLDVLGTEIERFRAGDFGQLDVGTFQSVSVSVLPFVVRTLRASHPTLVIRPFESDDDAELNDRTRSGDLELTFTVGSELPAGLGGRLMCHDPFVVVAHPDDVDAGPVDAARLGASPLIGQYTFCQRNLDTDLRAVGCEPSYFFRTNDNAAVIAMVRAGMGMAVLPLLAVDLADTSVAIRPLDPPIPDRLIWLAWPRGRTLSPAAELFVELAAEFCATLDHRREVLKPAVAVGRRRSRRRAPLATA